MNLQELEDIFEHNDEEIILYVQNMRTYTVNERKDHFHIWKDQEFFDRFRLAKNTVRNVILPQVEDMLQPEQMYRHIICTNELHLSEKLTTYSFEELIVKQVINILVTIQEFFVLIMKCLR